ncbi:MAG: VOC family protein [Chitinophagales bacterium]
MTNELWISLPVKDINKSKEFFAKLGFSFTQHGNTDQSAGLQIGKKKVVVMLFTEAAFRNIIQNNIADANQSNEVMISIDAGSPEEVDELARKAEMAGGNLFGKPAEHQGWMYGCGFSDLDGHRWNVLYMDMSKMPSP